MKLIITAISLFVLSLSWAQKADELGKISLSVVTPENSEYLNSMQLSKLRNKVLKIASSNGMSSSGFNSNFVMYPIFEVYDEELIEGMENIFILDVEVTLVIKQVENNMIFSTFTTKIEGSGNNKSEAIVNSISQIPTKSSEVNDFVKEAKHKIIDYYEAQCQNIATQAETAAKKGDFQEAFAIIMAVPSEVSCSQDLSDLSIRIYKEYQNKICKENMLEAQSRVSAGEYDAALDVLSDIDPSSVCYSEAKSTISKIESKVSAEKKQEWDFMLQRHNDEVSLQKERINAVKDIAVAYYKGKSRTYNYTVIVR
jgi:hypothetical protein